MARRKKVAAKKATAKKQEAVKETKVTEEPVKEEVQEEAVPEEAAVDLPVETDQSPAEESEEKPEITLVVDEGKTNTEILSDKNLLPEEKIEALRGDVTSLAGVVVSTLDRYVASVSLTSRVDPEKGGVAQHGLLGNLKGILNTPDYSDFAVKWTTVNTYAQAKKDAEFNMSAAYRFAPQWPSGADSIKLFQNLMDIVIRLSDPGKRKENMKKIDLNRVINDNLPGLSATAKEHLIRYYGLNK
jgi:hypothetical protein